MTDGADEARWCRHCGNDIAGSSHGEVGGVRVCHTGTVPPQAAPMDCYRLVTVYGERLGSRLGFGRWVSRASEYQRAHPELRTGQAWFGFLNSVRPDLADMVVKDVTARVDPFYDDTRFAAFLSFVEENW